MKITSGAVSNYKCFHREADFQLSDGFNVIVGKNNAGKSTLLSSLGIRFTDAPFRNTVTVPEPGQPPAGQSLIELSFELSGAEARSILRRHTDDFFVPMKFPSRLLESVKLDFQHFLELETVTIKVVYSGAHGRFTQIDLPHLDWPISTLAPVYAVRGVLRSSGEYGFSDTSSQLPEGSGLTIHEILANGIRDRIFSFRAERVPPSRSQFSPSNLIDSTASNLGSCLHTLLLSNRTRFDDFVSAVRRVLPDIHDVSLGLQGNEWIEIFLWPLPQTSKRDDLRISLADSGTGVAQVLAMLYIVVASDYQQVLLIDEPQSFLHPGAVSALFDVIREIDRFQHQIVLTTHSPQVINAARPSTVLSVVKEDGASTIETIDRDDNDKMRHLLLDVGARLSDVFGADSILWVEGPTEEACFPLILDRIPKLNRSGFRILPLRNTGDLEGKHAQAIADIYASLCRGAGLLPPALCFFLDREGKTPQQIQTIKSKLTVPLDLLPRRMYENYLLHAAPLAELLTSIDTDDEGHPHTETEVQNWITTNQWDPKYFDSNPNPSAGQEWWLENVHAGKLLSDLFVKITDSRCEYLKVQYGPTLTELLLKVNDTDLLAFGQLIATYIPKFGP